MYKKMLHQNTSFQLFDLQQTKQAAGQDNPEKRAKSTTTQNGLPLGGDWWGRNFKTCAVRKRGGPELCWAMRRTLRQIPVS